METFNFSAMNTHIMLVAEGEQEEIARGFKSARDYIVAREAQFTRFHETSELSALNRSAGTWFNASPELFALMQEAYALHLETNGLFHPAVLRALEHAGYDASMEIVRGRVNAERADTVEFADFRAVSFLEAQRAIWMPEGMRVDLGGIAKGWIAEQAAQVLAEYAEACAVNAGGDLFAIGVPEGADAWEVEIEDPNDAEQTIAVLRAPAGAVATSSITKRKWKQGIKELHHLIDPRTGEPAETDWVSVTVLAPQATVAEVFAKALLIGGSAGAGELSARREEIEYIAVDRDNKLWGSERARGFLDGTG